MKNEKFVDVNGAQVMDLTPNHDRPLAIVDLKVLKALSEYLPKGDVSEIIEAHVVRLRNSGNLTNAIEVSKEFVAFHETVNLIKEVEIPEDRDEPDYNYEG